MCIRDSAIWHIGISYVSMYLIAVGAKDTYDLKQKPGSSFWPQFYEADPPHAQFGVRIVPMMTRIHLKK